MGKQVIYIGIDVGARELWCSRDGLKPRCFAHTSVGIRALQRWSLKRAEGRPVHVCIESTGVYGLHVAFLLSQLGGTEISLVNPACIAAFARAQQRRSKTDLIDAEVIRGYAESQKPKLWRPVSKSIRQLYELVAQAEAIQASLQQWSNRRHAHGFVVDLPEAVIKTQRSIERSLLRQLQQIEAAIDQLCASDAALAQQILLLETIPGIARKSAIRLIAFGQAWLTQRSAKALVAHAGLAPHHRLSGSSVRGRSTIDKQGNRKLRKTLYMPALVGIVHNPIIRAFYQRLCNNGKQKKVALVACMKKLLLMVRSMLINKKTFNPKFLSLT